ncbi:hypothetical protein NEOLEDRAFT_1127667 [Neolentinus lepideus HHB14362 ss-1]|uniref:Uncharacterized protein n=1 Tax=Neolentinus lepideus HHB14362 ss-1 TaxID=1314782 RepID=A0A165VKK1_9AGAM|nr:hypothetical protein NEOLEDRAFT_1127667 [Neolentinus lepideus HHB14362 ss-1]
MAKKSRSPPHTDAPPFLRFPIPDTHDGTVHGNQYLSHHRVRAQTLASAASSQRPPKHFGHLPNSPYQMNFDSSRFSPPARDLLPEDPFARLSHGPDLVSFATPTQSFASLISPSMSTITLQATSRSYTPTPDLSRCSSVEDSPVPITPPAVSHHSRSSFYTAESEANSGAREPALRRVRTRPELKSSPSTISLASMVKVGKGGLFRRKAKIRRPQSPPEPCPSLRSCGSDDTTDTKSVLSQTSSYTAPRLPWLQRVLSRPSTPDKLPPLPLLPVRVQVDAAPEVQLRPISRFDVDFDLEMDSGPLRMLS